LDDEDYEEDLPNSALGDSPPLPDDIFSNQGTTNDESSGDDNIDDNYGPIPLASSSQPSSPKRRRIEDESFEEILEDIHPMGGKVLQQSTTIQQHWHEMLATADASEVNIFNPFDSLLDWRFVKWLVNEGSSKTSNDHLLEILSVSCFYCLCEQNKIQLYFQLQEQFQFSFHNMNSLKKKLEKLPQYGEWHEHPMCLIEDENEEHLIQYRNPLDVIQGLWSNPTYVDEMVFTPHQVWSSKDKNSRLYNEMWTGDWWWQMQVCVLYIKVLESY
jgi:hypothetical protein